MLKLTWMIERTTKAGVGTKISLILSDAVFPRG